MRHRVLMGGCALGAWVAAVAVKDVLRPAVASPMPPLVRLALGSAPSLLSALAIPLFFLAVHPRWRDWVAALVGVGVAATIVWALDSRTAPAMTEGEYRP